MRLNYDRGITHDNDIVEGRIFNKMINIIRMLVNTLHVISFCLLMLLGLVGVIYEIVGHRKFVQTLSAMGLSNGFEWVWILGAVVLIILMITYFIKNKLNA